MADQAAWKDKAKHLRAQGWTLKQIGERYGVSITTVFRALNPGAHGRHRDYTRSWNWKHKHGHPADETVVWNDSWLRATSGFTAALVRASDFVAGEDLDAARPLDQG